VTGSLLAESFVNTVATLCDPLAVTLSSFVLVAGAKMGSCFPQVPFVAGATSLRLGSVAANAVDPAPLPVLPFALVGPAFDSDRSSGFSLVPVDS